MHATVVVPTYERPTKLRETLESLCDQTLDDYRVVVVDDGSDSEAQDDVLKYYGKRDRITVLKQVNAGPAAARNRGWRAAEGEFVLFTDDDCVAPSEWVETLTEAFEPNVAAVGGPLVPRDDLLATNVFARAHRFRDQMNYGSPTEPTTDHESLDVGGTANVAYRRRVLEEVGGFDETFPLAAGEDADLQKRVLDAGYDLKFVPVTVRHNDDYDWESFVGRAVRSGKGTDHFHRKHGVPRSPVRIITGLFGSAVFLPAALRQSHHPGVAVLYVFERMLNRWGELVSTLGP